MDTMGLSTAQAMAKTADCPLWRTCRQTGGGSREKIIQPCRFGVSFSTPQRGNTFPTNPVIIHLHLIDHYHGC